MAVLFWCIYLFRLDVSHPRVEPLIAFSHILELNSGVKLSSPSQKWRAFPQTSAERFTFLPAFESNVPFLGAMSHILELNSGSRRLTSLELSSKRHRLKPFEVSPHDCKQSLAANLRTVIAYERLFSHPGF